MSKVIEDTLKDAGVILTECTEVIGLLLKAHPWVQPSSSAEALKVGGPAKYIVLSRKSLQEIRLGGFERSFPHLSNAISRGSTSDASNPRLIDGIYKLGKFNMLLEESRYMLKTDAQREQARALLEVAIGDFAIFVIAQYQLASMDTTFLSVSEFCMRRNCTKEVFHGELLNVLDTVHQAPYGYEEVSVCYDEMMGVDPAFLSECEEANFPLTEDMCRKIIAGEMPIEVARGRLVEFMQNSKETEVKGLNTGNILHEMHLG